MSRETRRLGNNGAEQLSLFGEEQLAKLQVAPLPAHGETPLSLEADGICEVTSQDVKESVATRDEAIQLRLPEV